MMDPEGSGEGSEKGAFSEQLRAQAEPSWDRMVRHRFTRDVTIDTLPSDVWRRYLIYEHAFVETAVTIFGYALVKAPSIDEQSRLSAVVASLTTDQIDYFDDAFERVGITDEERRIRELPVAVSAFRDGMLALAAHGTYEEIIGGMTAAEWMYLTWCTSAQETRQREPTVADWVRLHVTPEFTDQVGWLRGQLDAHGPQLAPRHRAAVAAAFQHTLDLEITFHHAPYGRSEPDARGTSEV